MGSIFNILGFVIAGLYLLVSIMCGVILWSNKDDLRIPVRTLAAITVALHAVYILILVVNTRRLPMASPVEAVAFTSFILALTYIVIHYTSKESGTGLFLYPVIFMLQAPAAFLLTPVDTFNPILASPYFALHTIPTILGYAAFLIAMKYGLMYLLMYSQIKSKKTGKIFRRMPDLNGLDKLNTRSVITGFTFLTIGIVTGSLWATSVWEDRQGFDLKLVAGFVPWVLYGISIQLRYLSGWRGKRVAFISVIGGVMLLLFFMII
jgi:ABC-type uncharacterized transport system permease subunit